MNDLDRIKLAIASCEHAGIIDKRVVPLLRELKLEIERLESEYPNLDGDRILEKMSPRLLDQILVVQNGMSADAEATLDSLKVTAARFESKNDEIDSITIMFRQIMDQIRQQELENPELTSDELLNKVSGHLPVLLRAMNERVAEQTAQLRELEVQKEQLVRRIQRQLHTTPLIVGTCSFISGYVTAPLFRHPPPLWFNLTFSIFIAITWYFITRRQVRRTIEALEKKLGVELSHSDGT